MNMLFELGDTVININKIKQIGIESKKAVSVTFDDDTTEIYGTYGDAERAVEQLGKTILQLIPCITPMYNIYKNGDGTYFHDRVYYLALCADGCVRSLAAPDYFFELADEANNFVGVFTIEGLKDYPVNANES
jgi:hypothetical protein